jgi:uncharacterized protein
VADTGSVLATHARIARDARGRMRGLIGEDPLGEGECLLLEPAAQVHTFGMRAPIDVVFCDKRGVIVHVVRAMRPMRITRWVRGARRAIELPANSVPAEVSPGTRLIFYEDGLNGQ